MTHLAPDELVDAVDSALTPARRAHLDTCEACHREVASLRSMLGEVRANPVPEPSPLFWDHFSARVERAITDGDQPRRTRWFHVPVLAPLGALALLVVALISAVGGKDNRQPAADAPQVAAAQDGAVDLDGSWTLVEDLLADLDLDAAREQGVVSPMGAADAVLLELSLGEQQELIRLLRQELRSGG
jgi:hypothetical protein